VSLSTRRAFGLDPIDFLDPHEDDPAGLSDNELSLVLERLNRAPIWRP
jgi:hypothetical protein